MSDDATTRGAQVAMLGIAAATLILADPSERSQRLADADREIAEWPADGARLKEKLEKDCQGWTFNVPPRLTLAWFDANLHDASECARTPGNLPRADGGPVPDPVCTLDPKRAEAAADRSPDAGADESKRGDRRGVVTARGYALLVEPGNVCPALAAPAATTGSGGALVPSLCDLLGKDVAAACQPKSWHIVGTVGQAPAEDVLEASSRAFAELNRAAQRQITVATEFASASANARKTRRAFGTPGADREQRELSEAEHRSEEAADAGAQADAAYNKARQALETASAGARDAARKPDSNYVLIGNEAVPFWCVARGSDRRPGKCLNPCSESSDADRARSGVPDVDACIITRDVEVATADPAIEPTGFWTSCGGTSAPPRSFDIGLLARTGVWNDLREDDPLSAHAKLRDMETKAELEGEIFGLKLASTDAVRWAWLPIAALEAYAVRTLRAAGAKAASDDFWAGNGWQAGLGACAVVAVAYSVLRGLRGESAPSLQYLIAVAVLLLTAIYTAFGPVAPRVNQPRAPVPDLPRDPEPDARDDELPPSS